MKKKLLLIAIGLFALAICVGCVAISQALTALWPGTTKQVSSSSNTSPQVPEAIPSLVSTVVPTDCRTVSPRLTVGGSAKVTQANRGAANSLRTGPGMNNGKIANIPAGVTMKVIGGPVCASGYNYWQVTAPQGMGWTAEGDASTYWLEPVGWVQPTDVPATPVLGQNLTALPNGDLIYAVAKGSKTPPAKPYVHISSAYNSLFFRATPVVDKTRANVLGTMHAGDYYQLVSVGNGWYQVITSLGTGWVSAQYAELAK